MAQQLPTEVVRYADSVFHNGTVLTMDERYTVAQAVAVRDGKILAVGSHQAILRMAGPQTKRFDLKGQTLIPGIINTHTHPNRYAGMNPAIRRTHRCS